MWQIQANECNPCQAPPGQQGSEASEAPLSSPPLPPGLHGGGEAIGGESIGFPIECRMVLASSRFTTTEDHNDVHATFVANLCHLLPLLTQLAGVAREEFGRKGAEHDYKFLQNLLDKSGICDKCNGSLFADATWKL